MEDTEVCGSKSFHEQNMDLGQYVPDEVQKGFETFFDDSQQRIVLKLRINCYYLFLPKEERDEKVRVFSQM